MKNEFKIGDTVQIKSDWDSFTYYTDMANYMNLSKFTEGVYCPKHKSMKIIAAENHLDISGKVVYGVRDIYNGNEYIVGGNYMVLSKPTQQYTLDDLRNKYVRVGTPEYEVFMDACEELGITWSDGKNCREIPSSAVYVGYDAVAGLSYSVVSAAYGVAGFRQFIPKQPQLDTITEETSWTIYNNTLSMSELTGVQAVELFLAGKNGKAMEYYIDGKWYDKQDFSFVANGVYRVKPKSELDEFVDKALEVTNYKGKYGANDVAYIARILYDNGCRFV